MWRSQGIGDWCAVNGESIRGTTRTPVAGADVGESHPQGEYIVFARFQLATNGQLVVAGLKSEIRALGCWIREAAPAKTSGLKISRANPLDVSVGVPAQAPDKVDSVVVLECAGDMMTDTNRCATGLGGGYVADV